jgi:hypothetical protein
MCEEWPLPLARRQSSQWQWPAINGSAEQV